MTRSTRSKDSRPLISTLAFRSALAFSLFCAGGIHLTLAAEWQPASAEATQAPASATLVPEHDEQPAGAVEGATGMRIYRDPVTGELGDPPTEAPAQVSVPPDDALSTSSEGLVEIPSPVPGGGVMLDLQGRFRSPLIATQDAEGKITIRHLPSGPSAGR
jgi:hypothetical protein